MFSSRSILLPGPLLSVAAYGLVLVAEAAKRAEGLGFAERFGFGRLADGFGKVGPGDFHLKLDGWEYVALAGMLAALLAGIAGVRRVPGWLPPVYLGGLLASGGWAALVTVLYLPLFLFRAVIDPLPMDGEFFDDLAARYMMAGLWPLFLLLWISAALFRNWPGRAATATLENHV